MGSFGRRPFDFMRNICYKMYEIISNLDQWLKRRWRLKHFLSRTLAAILFGGEEPFRHFGRWP